MVVRFFTSSQYHGKPVPTGSDYIRAYQLINNWDEADIYKYGEFPDVLIFNKVFIVPDYHFPKHFENIKILDICDPMWLEGVNVVETCQAMDAITCPTEALAEFIRQFHRNVVVIPDRFDLRVIPPYKQPKGRAKKVLWFGYAHNVINLKPAMPYIRDAGVELVIISNEDPQIQRWGVDYTFVRYDDETIYQEMQKCDFAVLPDGYRPQDKYKSNNREIKANLAGLPVAKTPEDIDLYMTEEGRKDWINTKYEIIKAEYDVNKSIEQYKHLINKLTGNSLDGRKR